MTDRERVARKLLHDGQVRPRDFYPPTCDGGKPTSRIAARIRELREEGWNIKTEREGREARYILTHDLDGRSGIASGTPSEQSVEGAAPCHGRVASPVGAARAEARDASAGTGSQGAATVPPDAVEPVPLFEVDTEPVKPRGQYDAWESAA